MLMLFSSGGILFLATCEKKIQKISRKETFKTGQNVQCEQREKLLLMLNDLALGKDDWKYFCLFMIHHKEQDKCWQLSILKVFERLFIFFVTLADYFFQFNIFQNFTIMSENLVEQIRMQIINLSKSPSNYNKNKIQQKQFWFKGF